MANDTGLMTNPFDGNSNAAMSVDDMATELGKGLDDKPDNKSKSNKEPEIPADEERVEAGLKPDDDDEVKIVETPEDDSNDNPDDEETDLTAKPIELEDEVEYTEFPTRKQILKDYPDLFKKHPQIEKAIYRAREFSEIFPSIADAKSAKEDLGTLNNFRSELLNGNVGNILQSVKEVNPKALNKIADEFMMTLNSVDQNAAFEVMNQIGKTLINQAFLAGKNTKNQQLEWAAQHLHNFFYNNPEVTPYQRAVTNQTNPEMERLNQERVNFERTKLSSAVNDITSRVDSVIQSTLDKYIDPDKLMTPYIRKNAINEAMDQMRSSIGNDKRLQTVLGKLYEEARNNNYDDNSKRKIIDTIKKKAQAILSDTIIKVRTDALKGLGTRSRSASQSNDEKPVSRGRPATSRGNNSPNNQKDVLAKTRGMSTADALNALMGDS